MRASGVSHINRKPLERVNALEAASNQYRADGPQEDCSLNFSAGQWPGEIQMSIHYVYGLRAAGTDEIRYVGVTNDPQVRLWAHLRGDNLSNPGLCEWALSHDIRMDILATTENEAERRALEEKWIRAQRAMGADLFNIRAGKQYVMTRQERVDFLSDWLDKHEKSPI